MKTTRLQWLRNKAARFVSSPVWPSYFAISAVPAIYIVVVVYMLFNVDNTPWVILIPGAIYFIPFTIRAFYIALTEGAWEKSFTYDMINMLAK